jgi:hypothetical protein
MPRKVNLVSFVCLNPLNPVVAPKPKPTLSTFGMGSALAGKRDSFGKLLISSSNSLKDQLHTLVEEEEEEEEETVDKEERREVDKGETVTPFADPTLYCGESHYSRPVASLPSRPRPANLSLRPLSLKPESLPLVGHEGLPTPSPTPSPRIAGLKTLMLAPSPSPSPVPSNSSASSRRQSLSVSPSPPPMDYVQRRQSLGSFTSPTPASIKRKSSISYKRTSSTDQPAGSLPTPEPTPTSPLPPLHATFPAALPSLSGTSSNGLIPDLDRPLSPTEQAFLFRSHTSLLCRISDLEQAIAGGRLRSSSCISTEPPTSGTFRRDEGFKYKERPTSITSSSTTSDLESLPSQPSDEMLQLVSDLKAERDELVRDADGWRMRVTDLEKQIGTLTRRVDAERREAWVIRERLGLVEVEKKRIKEDMECCRLECRRLEKAIRSEEGARAQAEEERDILRNLLKAEGRQREVAEREVQKLRVELEQRCARAEQAEADLQALLVTPKVDLAVQIPVPRRFNSVDSEMSTSSITDVEEYVPVGIRTKLNAVEEEAEDRDIPRDVTNDRGSESDNDELAHYEDGEDLDDDVMFDDDETSSSFGSIVRSNSHLLRLDLAAAAVSPATVPTPVPSHAKSGSMERGWSFPQGHGRSSPAPRDPPKVDHFFECLDALDATEAEDTVGLPTYDSATAKQFWRGAVQSADDDEELPPFILPSQPKKEKEWKDIEAAKLEVVTEEPEEDFSFKFQRFPSPPELRSTHNTENDPVTPRAMSSHTLPESIGTLPKHAKVRKSSVDFAIPGFKPYSGSVPVLQPAPPSKRGSSPAKDSPTTPTAKAPAFVSHKPTSPTLIPQPTYKSQLSGLTTPPKPRASNAGSTFILSTSPKTSLGKTMSTTSTPTKSQMDPALATKQPAPSKAPVFMPQPKMTSKSITRSSLLPPTPPMLTRPPIPQQTAAPAPSPLKQGLTSKLSQQMQSLTSLWSPWSSSSDTVGKAAVEFQNGGMPEYGHSARYVSKERQLDRLWQDIREDGALTTSAPCSNCRDGVIII